jgi:hypothetical protein
VSVLLQLLGELRSARLHTPTTGSQSSSHERRPTSTIIRARRYPHTSYVVNASVELLRLQQSGAPQLVSAKLRNEAFAALMQPY